MAAHAKLGVPWLSNAETKEGDSGENAREIVEKASGIEESNEKKDEERARLNRLVRLITNESVGHTSKGFRSSVVCPCDIYIYIYVYIYTYIYIYIYIYMIYMYIYMFIYIFGL